MRSTSWTTARSTGRPDHERFWAEGKADLEGWLSEMGLEVAPTDVVLDLGCGVGRMTRALAEQAREVVGLDISEEMLRQARALNADVTNVSWVHGDGASLDGIPDASVDGCVSVVVFQHLPDPAITLGYIAEIGRVLQARWVGRRAVLERPVCAPAPRPVAA